MITTPSGFPDLTGVEEGFAEDLLAIVDDNIQRKKEILSQGMWEHVHEARELVGEIRSYSLVREEIQRLSLKYFNLRIK